MFDLVLAYASSIHHGEMEEKQEEVMFSQRIGADYDYREETVYGGKKIFNYVAKGSRKTRWEGCSEYTKWELKVAQYARKFLGRNVIFMRDIYGNNALHLCVLHKLQAMFVHVKGKAKRLLEIEIRDAYSTFLQVTLVALSNVLLYFFVHGKIVSIIHPNLTLNLSFFVSLSLTVRARETNCTQTLRRKTHFHSSHAGRRLFWV